MNLSQLASSLGIADQDVEKLRPTWDQAQAAFDPATPWLPDETTLEHECRWLGLSQEPKAELIAAAREIRQTPQAVRLLWYFRWQAVGPLIKRPFPDLTWPTARGGGLSPQAVRWIQGVWAVSLLPHIRTLHQSRGIPAQVTQATFADIGRWATHHRQTQENWACFKAYWLIHHLTGRLFELGRLQFGISRFTLDVMGLRSRQSPDRVVSLARHGLWIDRQGRNMGSEPAGESDIQVRLDRYPHELVGHRVIEGNLFSLMPERYPLDEWQIVVEPGDAAIDVHIPAGDPLTAAALDESFRQVRGFFARHIPEHPVRVLTCQSWLLDPQFDRLMPSCNIAGFARRFHAVPSRRASDDQMWDRAFGKRYSLDEAPGDNSLRRGLIAHMRQGGRWLFTDGFILSEELPA